MSFQGQIKPGGLQQSEFRGGLAEGTNIRTPCGLRRIELVRPGDLVVTRNMGLQSVRMVWKRTVRQADMEKNPGLAPVRLKPRAVGPMMPQRDLLVSQDHRLLIPGFRVADHPEDKCVLVEAGEIAGSSDAIFIDRSLEEVTYYQMVFDQHHVLMADGLPVESFLPNVASVETLCARMRDALVAHFPQLRKEPNSYPPAEYQIASDVHFIPNLA